MVVIFDMQAIDTQKLLYCLQYCFLSKRICVFEHWRCRYQDGRLMFVVPYFQLKRMSASHIWKHRYQNGRILVPLTGLMGHILCLSQIRSRSYTSIISFCVLKVGGLTEWVNERLWFNVEWAIMQLCMEPNICISMRWFPPSRPTRFFFFRSFSSPKQ